MKGDDHATGARLLCVRGLVQKKVSSNQEKNLPYWNLQPFQAILPCTV